MPLENATTINQLDDQWPHGGDSVDAGDDHIRLIKHVLKSSFPGPAPGNGFSIPLTVDPALLNNLQTTLNNINASIKNARPIGSLEFRADNINPGTLFPGTVWALLGGDYCVAVGNGTNGGTTGGNNNPVVPLPAHNHSGSISISAGGEHAHTIYMGGGSSGPREAISIDSRNSEGSSYIGTNDSTQPGGNHSHGGSVTINNNGTAGATIDVRGARLYLNIWKRTA